MRATAVNVMSRGLSVYTCVNVVSSFVGQFASPWTRMSMRPTPFGCCARAATFKPTPAGMLSPFVGETTLTFGTGDDIDAARAPCRRRRAISVAMTTTIETVERRVGGADRLEVATNRRVAQPGAERARRSGQSTGV